MLAGFRSARSVALLRGFLDDPSFTRAIGPDEKDDRKVYSVRQAAYEVLRAWKVEVPKPLVEEAWPTAP